MPALRRGGRGDQVPRVERMMPTRGLKGASRVTLSESSEFLKGLSAQGREGLPSKPKSPLQRYRLLRKGKDDLA